MTFTTNLFLIGLLPWFISLVYLLRKRMNTKIILLLLANTLFYVWGGVGSFLFVCGFSALIWIFCLIIRKFRNKAIFGTMLVICLLPLILAKYLCFVVTNVNFLCDTNFANPELVMPIGISFFTFEALSLLTDIYKGIVTEKVSLVQVYSYLTFFATVTSGPIVRFSDFRYGLYAGIDYRKYDDAIERIVLGLCKKVLLADKVGMLADYYFEGVAVGNTYSVIGLWMGSIAYTLQLYFDFSGYSDIAIGIGVLLGFHIDENFDKPYQAVSISDFWRRWHISLSHWFRDYIYIPLGGNRCSIPRHIFNMLIVWSLTGIWHGADWTFVLWGLGYFILLMVEKYVPCMKKIGSSWVGHLYTLFFVNLLWVPFRASDLWTAKQYICGMVGIGSHSGIESIALRFVPFFIVCVLLCFPLHKLLDRFQEKNWFKLVRGAALICLAGLAVCTAVNASYTPYIYGNF